MNATKMQATRLFAEGQSIDAVVRATQRVRGTVVDYLADFLRDNKSADLANWLEPAKIATIAEAARRVGLPRLKPIFVELGERFSYEEIRLVVSHLEAQS